MLTGLAIGAWRVMVLEASELEAVSDWQPLVPTQEPMAAGGVKLLPHRELGRARLEEGEDVTFEVCAQDQLLPSRWAESGVELAVWIPETQKVVVRRPLDAEALERVERGGEGGERGEIACLTIAQGSALAEGGEYVIEAVWPERGFPVELNLVSFRSRVLAFAATPPIQRWPVVIVLLGSIVFVIAFARRSSGRGQRHDASTIADAVELGPDVAESAVEAATEDEEDDPVESASIPHENELLRVIAAVGALVAAGFVLALVPLGGSSWGLVRALCLALVQVMALVVLVRPIATFKGSLLSAVGLHRPSQGLWVLGVALLIGLGLWILGQGALHVIPATGESPVGAMVAWPSGSYAIALASVVSPVAEELFFRGFIYGTLSRRYGVVIAFTTTVVIFACAHLPQSWGAWGGLTAIVLTGVGLTVLRHWTGSTLAPILAHLAHNSAITIGWVLVARG